MENFVSSFQNFGSIGKNDNDMVDRLSSRYTVGVIVVFAIAVTLQLHVGSAITCWVPKHFTGSHTKYTNSYCWVKNTYYLPFDEEIPKAHEDEKRDMIPYYQWIPFILLAQAVFFYMPSIVWNGLNQQAGVDADNILEAAHQFDRADKDEDRRNTLMIMRNQIDRFLGTRKPLRKAQFRHAVKEGSVCSTRR